MLNALLEEQAKIDAIIPVHTKVPMASVDQLVG